MKPILALRQRPQLAMTPHLQRAIRLLQVSTQELEYLIKIELEKNPLLEYAENEYPGEYSGKGYPEKEYQEKDYQEKEYPGTIGTGHHEMAYREPTQALFAFEENILKQHLLWQMRLTPFSTTDQAIALTLIDALEDNGYLFSPLTEILDSLQIQGYFEIGLDEIEAVLHRIQQFDPIGVGARSLSECLTLQLNALPKDTPWLQQTKHLVINYLEFVGKREYTRLKNLLNIDQPSFSQILSLLRKLNPKPGDKLCSKHLDYIIPDVIVRIQHHCLTVELNMTSLPKLKMNTEYIPLLKQREVAEGTQFLRQYVTEAQWFLKSIQHRQENLLKISKCIVEKQSAFFTHGEEMMQPLTLQDIAEASGLHESTVSRLTHQKYMHSNRGMFELKYFFSSALYTKEGKECSGKSIQALIKKIIQEEQLCQPLSDHQITEVLSQKGINVARRTVSKYRMALNIPTSHERRSGGE